jgi:hypothetical protein
MSARIHLSGCLSNSRIALMEKIQLQYSQVNKMVDCCYKLLSVMKNSWLILLNISADQDNAMKNAIRALFPRSFHRFYRRHMLKKYKDQLNQMYDRHTKLKDKLIYVIKHSLNPEQFEAEWTTMCDEFGLCDRVTIEGSYNDRHMWIATYFKEVFCGTI